MGNDFFAYVQHLEMLAFFSGYPLVYYFVRFLFRNASSKNGWRAEIVSILPYVYALIGTLYLGLVLKNLYPDYTIENLQHRIQRPYLNIWAILSILFWIPAVSRKQVISVLHSLVFFLYIVRDLFLQLTGISHDTNIIKNDMRIYTISIFLNLLSFILLALLHFLFFFRKKHSHPWSCNYFPCKIEFENVSFALPCHDKRDIIGSIYIWLHIYINVIDQLR